MKLNLTIIACLLLLLVNKGFGQNSSRDLGLIPAPQKIELGAGEFEIDQSTVIYIDSSLINEASFLIKTIEGIFGREVKVSVNTGRYTNNRKWIRDLNTIILSLVEDESEKKDSYDLIISNKYVLIKASTKTGIFYGIQTLLQLLPSKEQYYDELDGKLIIPQLQIKDHSNFSFRSLQLDCSAQFVDVSTIKKYIDLMAYYKMNYLQWKLTGNQGWRMEIEKYPRLTKVGAWGLNDLGQVVGGYYSKENIREIIQYAKKRHIEIIPEIEVPGNSLAILNAYPELACTYGPFELSDFNVGNKEILCAGKSEVYQFVFNVLDEVADLFPSKMIHIGGSQLNYYRWRNSIECQAKIREKRLVNEKGLEAYFIHSILNHLKKKNRVGALNVESIHVPLKSSNIVYYGGQALDTEDMLLGQYLVYDNKHYTDLNKDVREISVDSIYAKYLPGDFYDAHKGKLAGGVAHFKITPKNKLKAEKLLLPRMLPIAEHLWNYKKDRSSFNFSSIFNINKARLQDKGYSTGFEKEPYTVQFYPNTTFDTLLMQGKFYLNNVSLNYYSNKGKGKEGPFPYNESVQFDEDQWIELESQSMGQLVDDKQKYRLNLHEGLGKKYSCESDSSLSLNVLNDGISCYDKLSRGWEEIELNNLDVVVDLGEKMKLKYIGVHCYQEIEKNIFLPEWIKLEVSNDGKKFEMAQVIDHPVSQMDRETSYYTIKADLKKVKARYIRLSIKNIHHCPEVHPASTMKAKMAIGEIIIN